MEFGTLLKVRFDDQGNIFALDGLKGRISVFSGRDGGFLECIGRKGSGPGEYNYPSGFAFLGNGGMVISDFGAHLLTFLDSTYSYQYSITGFSPVVPVDPTAGPGDTFIGGCLSLSADEEGYSGTSFLGRFDGSGTEPEYIYRSYPLVIEYRYDEGEQTVNVTNADCVWDSYLDGVVALAVRSDSTYCVELFDTDGNSRIIAEREWTRIAKTEEELALGELNESMSRSDEGGTVVRREEAEEVHTFHMAISTLNFDSMGNIWVGQGYTSMPTFEVYDREGQLLRVVTIPELEGVRGLRFCFLGGSLAYDYAPLDYPKIYLLGPESPLRDR
jgi:hypothetical protein